MMGNVNWLLEPFVKFVTNLDAYLKTAVDYSVVLHNETSTFFFITVDGKRFSPDFINVRMDDYESFLARMIWNTKRFRIDGVSKNRDEMVCVSYILKSSIFVPVEFTAIRNNDGSNKSASVLNSSIDETPVLDLTRYRGKIIGNEYGI